MKLPRLLFAWTLLIPGGVYAQGQLPSASTAEEVRNVFQSFAVPDTPAFIALGTTPADVARPGTPRQFGVSLLNALGKTGQVQQGIAVDVIPYLTFAGNSLTLANYKKDYFTRLLTRAQFSLGTSVSEGEEERTPTRAAFGLRLTLHDGGDPRLDKTLAGEIKRADSLFDNAQGPVPPAQADGIGTADDVKDDSLNARLAKARKASIERNWNASKVEVGVAPVFATPDGSVDSIAFDGVSAWATGAARLSTWGQLILHGKYGPAADSPDAQATLAGLRLRLGTSRWAVQTEGSYHRLNADATTADDTWGRVAAGFELRLSSGVWLEAAFGSDVGRTGQPSRIFTASNLKWTFSEERLLR